MQDIFECGNTYHIFNRGNNREDIFREEKNYSFFLSLMKKYLLSVADIYAYCLMKNHYHILLRFFEPSEMEDATSEVFKTSEVCECPEQTKRPQRSVGQPLSNMLNAYAKSFNKEYHRHGNLFQPHPKRNRVTDDNYFRQLVVYIHLNPIKHDFSSSLDYPHSSYPAVISGKPTNLNRDVVLEYFDDVENFIAWHDFKRLQHEKIKVLEENGY